MDLFIGAKCYYCLLDMQVRAFHCCVNGYFLWCCFFFILCTIFFSSVFLFLYVYVFFSISPQMPSHHSLVALFFLILSLCVCVALLISNFFHCCAIESLVARRLDLSSTNFPSISVIFFYPSLIHVMLW